MGVHAHSICPSIIFFIGLKAEQGGVIGVWNTDTSLQVRRSTLNSNSAASVGGAIYVESKYAGLAGVELEQLEMNDNAAGSGAALHARGSVKYATTMTECSVARSLGAAVEVTGDLTVVACTFTSNAAAAEGGAVMLGESGMGSVLVGDGCLFENNSAVKMGGAVYGSRRAGATAELKLSACRFLGNTAANGGGAVSWKATADVTSLVVGSVFTNNTVTGSAEGGGALLITGGQGLLVNRSLLSSNSVAEMQGGAVYLANSRLWITASRIEKNLAFKGGGMACNGSDDRTDATFEVGGVASIYTGTLNSVVISSSTVSHNTAFQEGGAVSMDGDGYFRVVISSSNISHNTAQGDGGVAYVHGGSNNTMSFRSSTIAHNTAQTGGVVSVRDCSDTNMMISSSDMSHNTAQGDGGVAYVHGGSNNTMSFRSSTIAHNTAQVYGGAVSISSGSGNMAMIIDCNVSNNNAQMAGGAVSLRDGRLLVINSTLNRNTGQNGGAVAARDRSEVHIVGSTLSGNIVQEDGGACLISSSKVHISGVTQLRDNLAASGAAIAIVGRSDGALAGIVVKYNRAIQGGAIFVSHSDVTVKGCSFVANFADLSGGGVYTLQSKLVIDGACSFTSNEATDGGGIAMFYAELAVANSVFAHNTATSAGGGLYVVKSNVTLQHIRLESCRAANEGGGLFLVGMPSQVDITGSVITGCAAGVAGGGVQVSTDAGLSADQTTLAVNTADYGAGVSGTHNSVVSLHRCCLVNNTASTAGGALWSADGCQANISVSHLIENGAIAGNGGAVALASTVDNNTMIQDSRFEDNSAQQGAAIFLQQPPRHQHVVLRGLYFRHNYAVVGANIFWEYHDQAAGLTCQNCTHEPSTEALLVTSATTFGLTQGGKAVGAVIKGLSGVPFTPEITFVAYDFYGTITRLVQDHNEVIVHASDTGTLLDGYTRVAYASEGATFENLAMIAHPGKQFNMTFEAQAAAWEGKGSISVTVHLEPCQAGEQYLEDANVCERCDAGTIKFSNSSDPCIDCTETALTCHGGSSYTLKDDWWMAVESVRRACSQAHKADGVEECVLQRTHVCDAGGGCRSSKNRSNAAGETHIKEELLCAEDRRADVALCGSCSSAAYHMSASGKCNRCPRDPWRAWIQPIVLTLLVLILVATAWTLRKVLLSTGSDKATTQIELQEFTEAKATVDDMHATSSGVFEIWGGWLQVTTQAIRIFDQDAIPALYWDFLVGLDVIVNVQVFDWVGFDCLTFTIFGEDSHLGNLGGFYWSFAFYALIPLVLLPPSCRVAYRILTDVNISTIDDFTAHYGSLVQEELVGTDCGHAEANDADEDREQTGSNKHMKEVAAVNETLCKHPEVASMDDVDVVDNDDNEAGQRFLIITIFILTYIQPTVATYMFQVFNCDPIHFEDVGVQYFLAMDRRIECFSTASWWALASIAVFLILTYVVGMPIGLLIVLRYLHQRKRVADEHGRTYFVPVERLHFQKERQLWFMQLSPKNEHNSRPPAPQSSPVFLTDAPDIDSAEATTELLNAFNMLDLPIFQSYFGVMYMSFRRNFYWFTCYEMLRRLLQSSFIVLIRLADRRADVFFALFVANASTALQAYTHPFRDPSMADCLIYETTTTHERKYI
ncbi:hypothetical protein CYMTET_26317 [Cymbomonas tetramitiformis]|uniref:Right handed beta helix domain-containing protein n=1 Tax=Cymbomonas tetramitiformis TaxID=36881 RepID=A0AAE0FS25_9CHLO|nr:hypothetical protein CYMTET_26317 [Cymbomonas tetramitiformis]